MYALSAAGLLTAWEHGRGQPPVRQALALLEASCPDEPPEALAARSIGRRDAALLRLRQHMLGSRMDCRVACPACSERLEFVLQADDLLDAQDADLPEVLTTHRDGYEVSFRLLNSLDLTALARPASATQGVRRLLERCLIAAHYEGEPVTAAALPEPVVEAVAAAMAQADPLADVRLTLTCTACGHVWQSPFDIVTFLWAEMEAWAQRLLYDVHTLAAAYGWSESEILSMSAWRRQRYLEWVHR